MTRRNFIGLAVITAFALILGILTASGDRGGAVIADRGERLLPDFANKAEDIARIEVTGPNQATVLENTPTGFRDSTGFPADPEAIQTLITSLALLNIEERKTADPTRFFELDLAEPDADGGAGTRVVFTDADGDVIVDLVIGKRDFTVGGVDGGQFVRTSGRPASYLVEGQVKAPARRAGWFQTRLFETDPAAISAMLLEPLTGPPIELERQGEQIELIGDPPDGRTLDRSKVDRVTRMLSNLTFEDVRLRDDAEDERIARLTTVTADGIQLVMTRILADETDKEIWVRIKAEALENAVETRVADLNALTEGREFRLNSLDGAVFGWSIEELTRAVEQG